VKLNGSIQVGDLIYGENQAESYELDPQIVTTALLEAGLSREEVWPLLSVSKTNLEKGLGKLRRKDLLGAVLAGATIKVSGRIEFRKLRD
jgi:hypothetical protein